MIGAEAELRPAFLKRGWVAFPPDADTEAWRAAAEPLARRLSEDAELKARWLRCGGTWFAGVNIFPNDPSGAVPGEGVPPLEGPVMRFVRAALGLGEVALDPAQISVCYPGYPQPSAEESDAAFRFRRDRDAAHVDGLLRDAARNRSLGERHAFVAGIPLGPAHEQAAPLVVWEGSHEIMRQAFRERLSGIPPAKWGSEDLTEAYQTARREAFERCPRRAVTAPRGGAYVIHRLALHGVAPWRAPPGPGRAIAYFRPEADAADADLWIEAP